MAEKQYGVSAYKLKEQVKIALDGVESEQNIMIAYEPVWSIGSGGIEAPHEYVGLMHEQIRDELIHIFGHHGKDVPIIFGGSVNLQNATEYLKCHNVNGLFIDRSAWQAESFGEIVNSVNTSLQKL